MKLISKLLFLKLIFIVVFESYGSHIVGGEITITHLGGFSYELSMNLYRDASGIPAPTQVGISVTQRNTVSSVGNFSLPLVSSNVVPPEVPGCGGLLVVIERYFYSATVTLSPSIYNHPSGYLFSWSACCRNSGIANTGGGSQRTLTMFPPVVKPDGSPIINSTPSLFPPLADFGCVGQFYYQEFGGSDPDGDSLAYTFYTPFTSSAISPGLVTPLSAPYTDPSTMATPIIWNACYNVTNQINGFSNGACGSLNEPDRLRVDPQTGFLSVTPALGPAYYVIGVWCQEFRDINGDGVKELIGSVFRDYQLQVTTGCAPGILAGPFQSADTGIALTDTVNIPQNLNNRCFRYFITDSLAGNPANLPNPASTLVIDLTTYNFPDSSVSVSQSSFTLNSPTDTAFIDICFGQCIFQDDPMILDVVIRKWHCPKPLLDTVRLYFIQDKAFLNQPGPLKLQNSSLTINDTVNVAADTSQRCVSYSLFDSTAGTLGFGASEIEISLKPLNFNDSIVFPTPSLVYINNSNDSAVFDICFFDCAFSKDNEPFEMDVYLKKTACPFIYDTLRLYFDVDSIPIGTQSDLIPKDPLYSATDTVIIPGNRNDRCFEYLLIDTTSGNQPFVNSFFEIDVFPDSNNVDFSFSPNSALIDSPNDTVIISICFEDCYFTDPNETITLEIITKKEHCFKDIIKTQAAHFRVDKILNFPAEMSLGNVTYDPQYYDFSNSDSLYFEIRPNMEITFDLLTVDSVYDSISQYIEFPGSTLDYGDYGISFYKYSSTQPNVITQYDNLNGIGAINSGFKWATKCNLISLPVREIHLVTIDKYCEADTTIRKIVFDTFDIQGIRNVPANISIENVNYLPQNYDFGNIDSLYFDIKPRWTMDFSMKTIDSLFDTITQYIEVSNPNLTTSDLGINYYRLKNFPQNPSDTILQSDTLYSTVPFVSRFRWTPLCTFDYDNLPELYLVTDDKGCYRTTRRQKLDYNMLISGKPSLQSIPGDDPDATETFIQGELNSLGQPKYYFDKRVGNDKSRNGSGKKTGEALVFDLSAEDPDRDKLSTQIYFKENGSYLDASLSRQRFDDLGIFLINSTGVEGMENLNSTFYWDKKFINCEALGNSPIEVMAITTDGSCWQRKDTVYLEIGLNNGTAPNLELFQVTDYGTAKIEPDAFGRAYLEYSSEFVSFFMVGYDNDEILNEDGSESDKVRMTFNFEDLDFSESIEEIEKKNISMDYNFPFRYKEKTDTVSFSWTPLCSDRIGGLKPMFFSVRDNACPEDLSDSEIGLQTEMIVQIIPVGEFEPINVITPNGDGYNDAFKLYDIEMVNSEKKEIIEALRCGFQRIVVYNRWGQEVFLSNDSDFSWEAQNVPSGDYFYELIFENRKIKSYLKILK